MPGLFNNLNLIDDIGYESKSQTPSLRKEAIPGGTKVLADPVAMRIRQTS
jgi:hypothetical protein